MAQRFGYDSQGAGRVQDMFASAVSARGVDNSEFSPQDPDSYGYLIKNYDPSKFESEEEFINYLDGSTSTAPAMLTDLPTSSTDAGRPRTVAAGYQAYVGTKRGGTAYEEQKGKMTVMFRDGTLYNYYDVSPGEWQNFKSSISKGAPWLNKGFDNPNARQHTDGLFIGKPQGPADISLASEAVRRTILRVARNAQVQYATNRKVTINAPELRSPKVYKSKAGYVSKASANRAKTSANRGGTNPYK